MTNSWSTWIPDYFKVVSDRSSVGQDLVFLQQEEEVLRPWLRDGATLLDVGCATGYAFLNFQKYAVEYHGIDIVPEYIERGGRDMTGRGLPADRLKVAEVCEFARLGRQFDIVLCNTMLQHLPAVEPALTALSRLTREVLLLRTLTSDRDLIRRTKTHSDTERAWSEALRSEVGVNFNVYSRDGLQRQLAGHFSSVEVIADRYTAEHPVSLFATEAYSYSLFKCHRDGGRRPTASDAKGEVA